MRINDEWYKCLNPGTEPTRPSYNPLRRALNYYGKRPDETIQGVKLDGPDFLRLQELYYTEEQRPNWFPELYE